MTAGRLLTAALFALAVLLFTPAAAQNERSDAIDAARDEYAEIRAALDAHAVDDVAETEAWLRELRNASRQRLAAAERELESIRNLLSPLGPPAAEGEPPESEDLARRRTALNEDFARANSAATRIRANIFEANELLARLSAHQIQGLYQGLLERGLSPLSPPIWREAWASAASAADSIGAYIENWVATRSQAGAFAPALGWIIGALLVSILLFWPVDRWIASTFSQAIEKRNPTAARRVLVAGLKMLARVVPGLIGGFIIIETLRAQGLIVEAGAPAARALWIALVAYLLVSGFLRGLFAPTNPSWRIAPIEAARGRTISALILSIVAIFSLNTLFTEILAVVGGASELSRLIDAASAVVIAAALYSLCRRQLWRRAAPPGVAEQSAPAQPELAKDEYTLWRLVRRFGRAIAIVIVIAALAGYVVLAAFIASRFYYLAIILAVAWFARAILKESAQVLWARARVGGGRKDDEQGTRNFIFWSDLIINSVLALALLPTMLILFGVPTSNVLDMAGQAVSGFQVGGVPIPSLAKIGLAVGIFLVVMAVTRIAQTGFQKGPFAHTRIDPGVQNSLITLIGYAGLIVAAFAFLSALGFDLGNLALIAGALSVGIGFGLQSIVNNFISGLILLFERPIKVGDWVVTASGEGTVKKISVRSTEIETFNRASIIVPNSELISQSVTNWTHKNRLGRVIIKVGVSYGSDPELVREILLKCAKEHPQTLTYPASFVTWQDFGESSLDFDLRVYIRDIANILEVSTALRFAIFKAFKEAGVEIPFPQRDVHVKSWPESGVMAGKGGPGT
jgi:small-conductance mechanosensitive channel